MRQRSHLFKAEPGFRQAGAIPVSRPWDSWLHEQGSLTRRLKLLVGAKFRVQLVVEQWCKPFVGEASRLGVGRQRRAWVREVILLADDCPLVAARSVIPPETFRARHFQMARLGQRPLGEWLFAHPGLCRLGLEFARVEPQQWCSGLLLGSDIRATVWGRRSLYRVARHDLLVCEFFLPRLVNFGHDAYCSGLE